MNEALTDERYAGHPAGLGEVGDSGGGYQGGSDHVGVERASPRLGRDVDQVAQRSDSGGVDEGIDTAQGLGGLVNGGSA